MRMQTSLGGLILLIIKCKQVTIMIFQRNVKTEQCTYDILL